MIEMLRLDGFVPPSNEVKCFVLRCVVLSCASCGIVLCCYFLSYLDALLRMTMPELLRLSSHRHCLVLVCVLAPVLLRVRDLVLVIVSWSCHCLVLASSCRVLPCLFSSCHYRVIVLSLQLSLSLSRPLSLSL
jgi:hypothetical protein